MNSNTGTTDSVSITKTQTRLVENGMAAVVHSVDYGAGLSTWHTKEMCTDPVLADLVLTGEENIEKAYQYIKSKYNYSFEPVLGITWVPVGEKFFINEYDGWESVVRESKIDWIVA